MTEFGELLDFWFGAPQSPERGRPRRCWFEKDDAFDAEVRARFLGLHGRAVRGELSDWERTPLAGVALAVLLDQVPRNMFRGDARAFASDALALRAARALVQQGFDRILRPVERWFVYLPFEHAEDLAAQRCSLGLFGGLASDPASEGAIGYAHRHYEIIARFGRFPHRNAILGRASAPEEIEFLKQPGSSF